MNPRLRPARIWHPAPAQAGEASTIYDLERLLLRLPPILVHVVFDSVALAQPFGIDLNEFEPPHRAQQPADSALALIRESLIEALYDYFDAPPDSD